MNYPYFDSLFENALAEWSSIHSLNHRQSLDRESHYIKANHSRLKNFAALMYANILSQPSSNDGYAVVIKKEFVLTARYFHFSLKGFFDILARKIFHDIISREFDSPLSSINSTLDSNPLRSKFLDQGYSVRKNLFDSIYIDNLKSNFFKSDSCFTHGLTGSTITASKLYSIISDFNRDPNSELPISSGRWSLKLLSNNSQCLDELYSLLHPLIANKYHQIFMPYLSTPLLVDARLHVSLPMSSIERTNQQYLDSQALMWHSDWHGTSFMKAFIPLTPLSLEYGSHAYVSGSHSCKPYFYADSRYPDDVITTSNSSDLQYFSLSPGDCLFEDTSGIHKGIPGNQKIRILVTLLFQNNMIYEHDWYQRHPIMVK